MLPTTNGLVWDRLESSAFNLPTLTVPVLLLRIPMPESVIISVESP